MGKIVILLRENMYYNLVKFSWLNLVLGPQERNPIGSKIKDFDSLSSFE